MKNTSYDTEMIEGNHYLIKWFKGVKNIEVVVVLDFMLPTNAKWRDLRQARGSVAVGEFKGLTTFFDNKDILKEFGTFKNLKKNYTEYLI